MDFWPNLMPKNLQLSQNMEKTSQNFKKMIKKHQFLYFLQKRDKKNKKTKIQSQNNLKGKKPN